MLRSLPGSLALARPPARRVITRRNGQLGPGSLLAMPSGCIASDLRPLGVDEKRRVASYELLLSNETVSPVATYAYVDGRGGGAMQSWSAMTVPPFSAIAVTLELPLNAHGPTNDRVVVEVHADMAQLTLDGGKAPPPNRWYKARLATMGSAAALLVLGLGYFWLKPDVLAVAAPAAAVAGSNVDVAYIAHGARSLQYQVETPEGLQVRAGSLDHNTGSFRFSLPVASESQTYNVRVAATGAIGSSVRDVRIVAAAAPKPSAAPAPASIGSLATARQIVESGAPIIVGYRADADTGTVSLVNSDGAVVSRAPIDPLGTSMLRAPAVPGDREYAVVLHVARGTTQAESRIGIVVRSKSPLLADPLASPPAGVSPEEAPPGTRYVADADAPFALPALPVTAGGALPIAIVQNRPHLRIALTTVDGAEIVARNVSPDARSISLAVPAIAAPARLLVEATFDRGIGQETVIRPIVIQARVHA